MMPRNYTSELKKKIVRLGDERHNMGSIQPKCPFYPGSRFRHALWAAIFVYGKKCLDSYSSNCCYFGSSFLVQGSSM